MRSSSSVVACLCAALFSEVSAAPDHYEVKSLPGWNRNGGKLVSRMWSGFASGGTPPNGKGDMMFNYVFIEAETKKPEKAPVVIWQVLSDNGSDCFIPLIAMKRLINASMWKIKCVARLLRNIYLCCLHCSLLIFRLIALACQGTMEDQVQPACLGSLWSSAHIT